MWKSGKTRQKNGPWIASQCCLSPVLYSGLPYLPHGACETTANKPAGVPCGLRSTLHLAGTLPVSRLGTSRRALLFGVGLSEELDRECTRLLLLLERMNGPPSACLVRPCGLHACGDGSRGRPAPASNVRLIFHESFLGSVQDKRHVVEMQKTIVATRAGCL